jgi:hypothetical protein
MISDFATADNTQKYWYNKQNQFHREDGPAVKLPNGINQWWVNGKLHRLDGPAIEGPSDKGYWINDKLVTEDGFPKAVVMFLLNCNEQVAKLILELL